MSLMWRLNEDLSFFRHGNKMVPGNPCMFPILITMFFEVKLIVRLDAFQEHGSFSIHIMFLKSKVVPSSSFIRLPRLFGGMI